jgi:hypothetical protein
LECWGRVLCESCSMVTAGLTSTLTGSRGLNQEAHAIMRKPEILWSPYPCPNFPLLPASHNGSPQPALSLRSWHFLFLFVAFCALAQSAWTVLCQASLPAPNPAWPTSWTGAPLQLGPSRAPTLLGPHPSHEVGILSGRRGYGC